MIGRRGRPQPPATPRRSTVDAVLTARLPFRIGLALYFNHTRHPPEARAGGPAKRVAAGRTGEGPMPARRFRDAADCPRSHTQLACGYTGKSTQAMAFLAVRPGR